MQNRDPPPCGLNTNDSFLKSVWRYIKYYWLSFNEMTYLQKLSFPIRKKQNDLKEAVSEDTTEENVCLSAFDFRYLMSDDNSPVFLDR